MRDNIALLEFVHEVTTKADEAIAKLEQMDAEYAADPVTNLDKRLTIAHLQLVLTLQNQLVRHLMEENQSILDRLEVINNILKK